MERTYTLTMRVAAGATTESIATTLEQAARQLRRMSSIRAAHSMTLPQPDARGVHDVKHGVEAGA